MLMPGLELQSTRDQAAGYLDLPAGSSPAAARSAFLSRLQRSDYLPAENWVAGVVLLDDSGKMPEEPMLFKAAAQSRRQLLNQQLDAFAGQYWQLPPEERQRRWNEFCEVSQQSDASITFVQDLLIGLDVTLDGIDALEGRTAELAQLIRDIYPLRLPERVARRRAWLTKTAKSPGLWQNSAARLRERMPALAALDPKLMALIALRAEDRVVMPARPLVRPEPVARKQEADNSSKRFGWLIFFIVMIVIRVAASGDRSDSSSSSSTYRPVYNPPDARSSTPKPNIVMPTIRADLDMSGKLRYVEPKTGETLEIGEGTRVLYGLPGSGEKKSPNPKPPSPTVSTPAPFQPK